MKFYIAILVIAFASCMSQNNNNVANIISTVRTYATGLLKEVDSTFILDSVVVLKIDTVSTKEDFKHKILKLQDSVDAIIEEAKVKNKILGLTVDRYNTLRYMVSLGSNRHDLSIFKKDAEDKRDEAKAVIDEMTEKNKRLDSLHGIYFGNTLDSTDFLYYGVTYKLCYSDSKLVQTCADSAFITITKEFRVRKY